MENNTIFKTGRAKIQQEFINQKVDQIDIEKLLLNNIEFIKKHLESKNDKFANEILEFLINHKKIKFNLSKHEEIFIKNSKKDVLRIIDYIIFRYKWFQCAKNKINIGYPPYLLIEPVSACQLRCPFCFQSDKTFTRKPFMGAMKLDLFKKIVDEADNLGVGAITIASRGEPSMHKKIVDMIKYVGSKKNIFEIKFNSNAGFLTSELCHELFKNNVSQVVISADHYLKKDFERLRLGAIFEQIVENVDKLYKIRNENYPDCRTDIRISGVDNDKNLDRKKFHDFWIKRADHVSASYPIERWDTYNNNKHPEINDPCEFLWDRMYIWFDGKTNPCDADYKSYLSYGKYSENTIKDLWNSQKLNDLRYKHLKNKRTTIIPCDRCGITF